MYERLTEKDYRALLVGAKMRYRDNYEMTEALDAAITLFDAKADGRLVELPCAVGDTVYIVHKIPSSSKKIIVEVQTDLFFIVLSVCEGRFGKTVFLTREAAEKALAEVGK
jgi:hypothetical protein